MRYFQFSKLGKIIGLSRGESPAEAFRHMMQFAPRLASEYKYDEKSELEDLGSIYIELKNLNVLYLKDKEDADGNSQ